jgi:hypothetical protein
MPVVSVVTLTSLVGRRWGRLGHSGVIGLLCVGARPMVTAVPLARHRRLPFVVRSRAAGRRIRRLPDRVRGGRR